MGQSSNFDTICKATEITDFHKLPTLFTRSFTYYTATIKHDGQYEPIATEKYESVIKLLCVSKKHPFLAASPNR